MGLSEFYRNLRAKVGHDLLLLPGVCGLVFNDAGEVLLGQRSDTGRWAVIGGMLDPGEGLADAAAREVFEETGVRVVPERVTGVYVTPVITYPNGDRAQFVITAFRCRPAAGAEAPRVNDDESLDVRYFHPDALPPDVGPQHRQRIAHARSGDGINAGAAGTAGEVAGAGAVFFEPPSP